MLKISAAATQSVSGRAAPATAPMMNPASIFRTDISQASQLTARQSTTGCQAADWGQDRIVTPCHDRGSAHIARAVDVECGARHVAHLIAAQEGDESAHFLGTR